MSFRQRVDPTHSLAPALCNDFHENLRSGNVERLHQMLEKEPLLAQARNSDRATPLLIAAVHPETVEAVKMIDLLMEKGAVLGSHDLQKRNVLLYACHHGVEWEVIECLMKWNAAKGGRILKWSHCDEEGRSSLILASEAEHTQLVLRLLDEIDLEKYAQQNHPLYVLQMVIASGNEPYALVIAAHPKIKAALAADDMSRHKGELGQLAKFTISNCVEAAVHLGMADVLQLMDQQNHLEVSEVAWRYIQNSSALKRTTNPKILTIAEQYAKDCRWKQAKEMFLIRHRGRDNESLRTNALVHLPDQLLSIVLEFIRPKEVCKREPTDDLFAAITELVRGFKREGIPLRSELLDEA